MTELRLVVPDGSGGRVDRVASDLSGLSRSRVQHLITDGHLTLDGVPLKARSVVRAGDALILQVPAGGTAGHRARGRSRSRFSTRTTTCSS